MVDESVKNNTPPTNVSVKNGNPNTKSSVKGGKIVAKSVDSALEQIQGDGTFDLKYILPIGLGYTFGLTYVMPLLVVMPSLLCSNDGGSSYQKCSMSDICSSSDSSLQFMPDYSDPQTVSNYMTNLASGCITGVQKGFFGSFYFVGFMLGAIFVLRLADEKGRKFVMIWTDVFLILSYICAFLSTSLYFTYAITLLIGVLSITRLSTCYMYMMEMTQMKTKFHSLVNFCQSVLAMVVVGFTYLTQNVMIILLFYAAFQCFHLYCLTRVPESPKFLKTQNRNKEMSEALLQIAKINGVEVTQICMVSQKQELVKTEGSVSVLEAMKDPIFKTNLTIMGMNWAVCSLSYYIVSFYASSFPGSMYINSLIMASAELISSMTGGIIAQNFGIKAGFKVAYSIISIGTIAFLCSTSSTVAYLSVFVTRFGLSQLFNLCYFSNSELFSPSVKAKSYAICNLVSRSLTILSPMVVELAPNPILMISIVAVIAGFGSQLLRSDEKEEQGKAKTE